MKVCLICDPNSGIHKRIELTKSCQLLVSHIVWGLGGRRGLIEGTMKMFGSKKYYSVWYTMLTYICLNPYNIDHRWNQVQVIDFGESADSMYIILKCLFYSLKCHTGIMYLHQFNLMFYPSKLLPYLACLVQTLKNHDLYYFCIHTNIYMYI